MTSKIIVAVLTVSCLASCQQMQHDNTVTNVVTPATTTVKDTTPISCSELSQSLIAGPFKQGTSPKELMADKTDHFKIDFEININPDNQNAKDTDVVATSGKSEVRFLKTGKETIIYAAYLYANNDALEDNCRIGMKRSDFIQKNHLKLSDSCDAVMVLSHNEALMVSINFKQDTISTISVEMMGD